MIKHRTKQKNGFQMPTPISYMNERAKMALHIDSIFSVEQGYLPYCQYLIWFFILFNFFKMTGKIIAFFII